MPLLDLRPLTIKRLQDLIFANLCLAFLFILPKNSTRQVFDSRFVHLLLLCFKLLTLACHVLFCFLFKFPQSFGWQSCFSVDFVCLFKVKQTMNVHPRSFEDDLLIGLFGFRFGSFILKFIDISHLFVFMSICLFRFLQSIHLSGFVCFGTRNIANCTRLVDDLLDLSNFRALQ